MKRNIIYISVILLMYGKLYGPEDTYVELRDLQNSHFQNGEKNKSSDNLAELTLGENNYMTLAHARGTVTSAEEEEQYERVEKNALDYLREIEAAFTDTKSKDDPKRQLSELLQEARNAREVEIFNRGFAAAYENELSKSTDYSKVLEEFAQSIIEGRENGIDQSQKNSLHIQVAQAWVNVQEINEENSPQVSPKTSALLFDTVMNSWLFKGEGARALRTEMPDAPVLDTIVTAARFIYDVRSSGEQDSFDAKKDLLLLGKQLEKNNILEKAPKLWFTITGKCIDTIVSSDKAQPSSSLNKYWQKQLIQFEDAMTGGRMAKAKRWISDCFSFTRLKLHAQSKLKGNNNLRIGLAKNLISDYNDMMKQQKSLGDASSSTEDLCKSVGAILSHLSFKSAQEIHYLDGQEIAMLRDLNKLDPSGSMIKKYVIDVLPKQFKTVYIAALSEIQAQKPGEVIEYNEDLIQEPIMTEILKESTDAEPVKQTSSSKPSVKDRIITVLTGKTGTKKPSFQFNSLRELKKRNRGAENQQHGQFTTTSEEHSEHAR